MTKIDYIRSAEKTIQVDYASQKEHKAKLEEENELIRTKLDSMHSIKELDIHIDILLDSDRGLEILREKYGKSRRIFERMIPSLLVCQDDLREDDLQRTQRPLLPDLRQDRVQSKQLFYLLNCDFFQSLTSRD